VFGNLDSMDLKISFTGFGFSIFKTLFTEFDTTKQTESGFITFRQKIPLVFKVFKGFSSVTLCNMYCHSFWEVRNPRCELYLWNVARGSDLNTRKRKQNKKSTSLLISFLFTYLLTYLPTHVFIYPPMYLEDTEAWGYMSHLELESKLT
jgi:hypothetical protein